MHAHNPGLSRELRLHSAPAARVVVELRVAPKPAAELVVAAAAVVVVVVALVVARG